MTDVISLGCLLYGRKLFPSIRILRMVYGRLWLVGKLSYLVRKDFCMKLWYRVQLRYVHVKRIILRDCTGHANVKQLLVALRTMTNRAKIYCPFCNFRFSVFPIFRSEPFSSVHLGTQKCVVTVQNDTFIECISGAHWPPETVNIVVVVFPVGRAKCVSCEPNFTQFDE